MEDPINVHRPPQQTPQTRELSDAHFVLTYGTDYLGRRFIKIRRHDMHLRGTEVDRRDEEGLPLEPKEIRDIAARYGFNINDEEYQVLFFNNTPRPHSSIGQNVDADVSKKDYSKELSNSALAMWAIYFLFFFSFFAAFGASIAGWLFENANLALAIGIISGITGCYLVRNLPNRIKTNHRTGL